jgi:ATP-binding cassette subfamily F protein 3
VSPRKGPALRCKGLSIGYPDRVIASGIDLEIEHGSRAAIVGDNGQGKTTFLRTLVGSLAPLAGEARWGYGCELGVYAQHVYTSIREDQTVLEHLERAAAIGTKQQRILDVAGAMLFRGSGVEKRVKVLSGGERARLCLAGLLLGSFNVLVLDEPGNHLDVETVDALAAALVAYEGTVVFTSHDRSFMQAVATTVIEVKDGRVVNTLGTYATYLAGVSKEIDDAEAAAGRGGRIAPPRGGEGGRPAARPAARTDREIRKEVATLEKTIARLDAEKRQANAALLATSDADEAVRLHAAVTAAAEKLAAAEERWLVLQEELAAGG